MYELEDEIRRRAYALWEREGRPHGRSVDHWLAAKRAVEEMIVDDELDEGLNETFPASDPPASVRRAGRDP